MITLGFKGGTGAHGVTGPHHGDTVFNAVTEPSIYLASKKYDLGTIAKIIFFLMKHILLIRET